MSKKVSREQMVSELKRLTDELGHTPTMKEMDKHGEYSRGPYYREFGSWSAALENVGLKKNKRENIQRDELIEAINDLHERLGRVPTRNEMNELGKFSRGPYDREFGGWNRALEAAGFDVNKPVELTREQLLSELDRLADAIDATPRKKDMNEYGEYSVRAYQRVFGNWNAALDVVGLEPNSTYDVEFPTNICEQCGDEYPVKPSRQDISRFCTDKCKNAYKTENWVGEKNPHPHAGERVTKTCEWCGDNFNVKLSKKDTARFCDRDCLGKHHRDVRSGKNSPRWRGGYEPYYGPNWRKQRRKRKEKDNHKCQRCGATNDLVVHHKIAFRKFANKEESIDYEAAHSLNNLVTVCRECHAKIENGTSNGFGSD